MTSLRSPLTAIVLLAGFHMPLFAQTPILAPTAAVPERPTGTAAVVNGQAIPEVAVFRRLLSVPREEHAQARAEIVKYLVDLVLIDQYLVGQKIVAEPKEIDDHLLKFRDDFKKAGGDYDKFLNSLQITEIELKQELAAEIRWEKFLSQHATEDALKKLFDANLDMFDGSKVRARHILLTPGAMMTAEQIQATLKQIKQMMESESQSAAAKLPMSADALAKEQERCKKMDELFAQAAREKSSCNSKRDGGDLNWFHRAGSMVEPFAKAAFALKPFQISEVTQTQFGYHLIMVTSRQPGQPTKYEEVKDAVRETYEVRLREAMASQLRQRSKIEIIPVK